MAIPKNIMVTITDYPQVAKQPVKPNKPMAILLGVIIGLVVGVGLAFFIEYLDTSVKTVDDVESFLGISVLGVIRKNVGILHQQKGDTPDAEAYRTIRSNIEFNRKNPEGVTYNDDYTVRSYTRGLPIFPSIGVEYIP